MKKKLELDMSELEGSLKRSTLENTDLQVLIRRQQESLRSKTEDIEGSRSETDNIRDRDSWDFRIHMYRLGVNIKS